MKQIVSALRRRGSNKDKESATKDGAAATMACDNATKAAANAASRPLPTSEVKLVEIPRLRLRDSRLPNMTAVPKPEATESTLAIVPEATTKVSEQKLIGRDRAGLRSEMKKKELEERKLEKKIKLISASVDSASKLASNPGSSGNNLVSTREKMWYKHQVHPPAKQKEDAAHSRTPTRISPRYESKDRGLDRYSDGIDRHATDSPKGIDQFEEVGMGKTVKRCDSLQSISSRPSHGDDNYTDMSSSLFGNDTQTKQSSSLFDEEYSRIDVSEFSDDYVEDSTTLGLTTLDGTASASASYLFELVDEGTKQRQKYQFGVGQNPKSSSRMREPLLIPATRQTSEVTSTSRRASAYKPLRHRRNKTKDDSKSVNDDVVGCPLKILEELSGTYMDAKLAFEQVLYAFVISPDDIDQISDTLSNAKYELIEMCHE